MRVKHLSLGLLFAAAIQSFYCADITKLSAEDRRVLQDSSRFHEVHATTNLPSAIVALCADDGRLAEPGQNWQATDVITDPTLPGKRLIWAAVGTCITSSITNAAESLTPFTFWLRNSGRMTRNRRWFGEPLEVGLKITQHLSTHCEAGSWTTV